MAELADAVDSKSTGVHPRAGSTPALGTKKINSPFSTSAKNDSIIAGLANYIRFFLIDCVFLNIVFVRSQSYLKVMGMALPYEVVKVIEEAVQDPEKAAKVIRAIEEGLGAVREEAKAQKEVVKAELKDELTRELVTKADLEILRREMREEMARLEAKFEARFVRLEIWLKVMVGVMITGFTLFNPGFHQFLRIIFSTIGS